MKFSLPFNLEPLTNNGGPTLTRALLPGSVALDAGDDRVLTNACTGINLGGNLTTDQRGTGFPQKVGGSADIGAYESSSPEIVVSEPGVGSIAGGGNVSFGTTTVGTAVTKTFTVTNSGTDDLTLSNLTVPSGFVIAANFGAATVAPSNSTTFTIQMSATSAGMPSGTLSFDNNDADENLFNFTISGTVNSPPPQLAVSKTHTGPGVGNSFIVNQNGTYTITVTNNGPGSTNGAQVTLTDNLPAGFTLQSIAPNAEWDCLPRRRSKSAAKQPWLRPQEQAGRNHRQRGLQRRARLRPDDQLRRHHARGAAQRRGGRELQPNHQRHAGRRLQLQPAKRQPAAGFGLESDDGRGERHAQRGWNLQLHD